MIPQHAPVGKSPGRSNPRPRPDNPDRYTDPSRWVARVPAAMLTADLDGMEMRVQLALESHAQHDPCTIVANETLAEMTASPLRTIQHALSRLDAKGWIARVYEGGVEPNKQQKARRVGIILRRRLDPERPAAGTDEDVERIKAALLTRKMLHGGHASTGDFTRKMLRVDGDFTRNPLRVDTQDVASDLRSPRVNRMTSSSLYTDGDDDDPERPDQNHADPEPPAQEPKTLEQMADMLPGHAELAPVVINGLVDEFGEDCRPAYKTVVLKVARREIAPESFLAGLRSGRSAKRAGVAKPGMDLYQTALAPVIVAPVAKRDENVASWCSDPEQIRLAACNWAQAALARECNPDAIRMGVDPAVNELAARNHLSDGRREKFREIFAGQVEAELNAVAVPVA